MCGSCGTACPPCRGGDISAASIRSLNLGIGIAEADLDLPRSLFYDTLSRQSGLSVTDDGDLMQLLTSLAAIRKEYDRLAPAMQAALDTGYGIVMPSVEELNLEDPEIVRQGGRYSVRMKASAPSIHMIRADIATTVSPIVGNEKQSEDMVNYLLQEFEETPASSGSPTSLAAASTRSWETTCRQSSGGCRRTPRRSCGRPWSASSTTAAAA